MNMPKLSNWCLAFAAFLVQFLVVYLVPLIIVVLISALLHTPDNLLWLVLDYALFGILGSLLALVIAWVSPTVAQEGRWVWTFGVGLLALCIGWDLSRGIVHALVSALIGAGEGGWVRGLVTLPAWGSCCYSAMMWRHPGRRDKRALA
jgi:hypothetical protein